MLSAAISQMRNISFTPPPPPPPPAAAGGGVTASGMWPKPKTLRCLISLPRLWLPPAPCDSRSRCSLSNRQNYVCKMLLS